MFFASDRFVVSGPNSDDHFASHATELSGRLRWL